ncbi:MAG TPA: methyltransferase domain-containing protein [Gammaproteobacteria bacterium]|nr:methyltransferase domain-containing protein [Gammaproteobacteria bacterium]
MTQTMEQNPPHRAPGLLLHTPGLYDLTVWLMTFGREERLREAMLDLLNLRPGSSVLDVGCGTGSLAIAAKRDVGPAGAVFGIDASPEMLARARRKARKAGLEVTFQNAPAQALPFPDTRFDAVLSTIMLHHLPRPSRRQCVHEMKRVLKPGGQVLVVEFAASTGKKSHRSHFHRHGHMDMKDILTLFKDAGLEVVESGDLGFRDLQFVVGTVPDVV